MSPITRPLSPESGAVTSVADEAQAIVRNKVSWGAILAGVFVGLITQVLLTMLAVSIGIATLDPMISDNATASSFSIGSRILPAADTAASVISTGSMLPFIALVVGAIAGCLGACSVVLQPVYADRVILSCRNV